MTNDDQNVPVCGLAVAPGSANRSAEAIIADLVEDPYENGSYRLDIRGKELDELWRAAERDNRSIYAKIIELNRLSDMASDALNSFRIQGKPVPEEVRKLLTALSPNNAAQPTAPTTPAHPNSSE